MLQLEVEISRDILGLDAQPTQPDLDAYLKEVTESRARALSRLDGDFARLLDFDRRANRRNALGQPVGRDPSDSPYGVERDAFGMPQPQFHFPLRDLNGVQYYFRELVRIGYGHFVLPQSPWGISGVGQVFIGRQRPWVSARLPWPAVHRYRQLLPALHDAEWQPAALGMAVLSSAGSRDVQLESDHRGRAA